MKEAASVFWRGSKNSLFGRGARVGRLEENVSLWRIPCQLSAQGKPRGKSLSLYL